jgi:hypothetical protein
MFVNNEEMKFKAIKVLLDKRCINVDGRYLIQYKYRKELKTRKFNVAYHRLM